jgi:hypothetical protein
MVILYNMVITFSNDVERKMTQNGSFNTRQNKNDSVLISFNLYIVLSLAWPVTCSLGGTG